MDATCRAVVELIGIPYELDVIECVIEEPLETKFYKVLDSKGTEICVLSSDAYIELQNTPFDTTMELLTFLRIIVIESIQLDTVSSLEAEDAMADIPIYDNEILAHVYDTVFAFVPKQEETE